MEQILLHPKDRNIWRNLHFKFNVCWASDFEYDSALAVRIKRQQYWDWCLEDLGRRKLIESLLLVMQIIHL